MNGRGKLRAVTVGLLVAAAAMVMQVVAAVPVLVVTDVDPAGSLPLESFVALFVAS